MHAPQAAVASGPQQELRSGQCKVKRKASSPSVPCKRFLSEQLQQYGRALGRGAGGGGEGEGSRAAPGTGKRKRESGGGSPAREKKQQRREVPGEQQLEEDFGQFSSFQYWRTPLPKLDLSDLLGLDGESVTEERASSNAEEAEVSMES